MTSGLGRRSGGDLLCGLEAEEGEREAFADAVVVDRKHVRTAEAEDEQHLDGPAADAAHLGEVLDDGLVGHAANAGEGGHGAIDGLGGEIAQGEALVVREAGGAQLLVGAVEQMLRIGMDETERRAEGLEAFEQAAMDGGRGLAVELLVDDGFDQCLERAIANWRGAG